jgi:hypothetical protein
MFKLSFTKTELNQGTDMLFYRNTSKDVRVRKRVELSL